MLVRRQITELKEVFITYYVIHQHCRHGLTAAAIPLDSIHPLMRSTTAELMLQTLLVTAPR